MKIQRRYVFAFILTLTFLLAFSIVTQAQMEGSDAGEFQAVWDRVRQSGSYRFDSDVTQVMTPLPSPVNAGREAKETRIYMDGRADLREEEMQLNIWASGGSVLLPESGMQIKVEGNKTYTRQGGSDWEEAENLTHTIAPGGDMMGYLNAAENIKRHEPERRRTALGDMTITRFTFDIDGRRFAEFMRDQLRQQENVPPGVKLQLAQAYLDMSGQGELWVGENGLPIRQIFDLQFPETADNYQTTVQISVTFSDFAPVAATSNLIAGVARALPGLEAATLTQQVFPLVAVILVLLLLTVIVRRGDKKTVYAPVALAIIASMLLTPLLTVTHVSAFNQRQEERRAEQEVRQAEFDALEQQRSVLDNKDFDPNRDPLQQARLSNSGVQVGEVDSATSDDNPYFDSSCETDPHADYDGDNLTNLQECILGTLPGSADTDEDGVDDGIEVAGVVISETNKTWYTDPLVMDSNNDGLSDGQEWYFDVDRDGVPEDTDNDGTPDIWDDDNDGDGVPDDLDLSPYMNEETVYNGDDPMELVINDLQEDLLVKVEFQINPTNVDNLWYSQNVWDWPFDNQGQIQDADGLTFYDLDPTLTPSPNDNGDMRLIPMLEIEIIGSPDNLPDAETLQEFGISVNQTTADTQVAYVPIQVVTDQYGEKNVAFYAAMFYEAAGQWSDPQNVNLVWLVQALNDQCETYSDNICTQYSTLNDMQVIQMYDDEWRLTGFSVTEEHAAAVDIIFEDPQATEALSPGYDKPYYIDALYGLLYGLDYTFIQGRDCDQYVDNQCVGDGQLDMDTQEIYRRFNHTTNDAVSDTERWGLPDVFTVQRKTYDSIDLGLMDTTVTQTINILDANFTSIAESTPITPTLMFAYEELYRGMNLDDIAAGSPNIGFSNNRLQVMLPSTGSNPVEVTTMHSLKWAPYSYQSGWMAADIQEFYDELTDHWGVAFSSLEDEEEAETYQTMAQLVYIAVFNGTNSIVQQGNSVYSPDVQKADSSIYVEVAGDIRKLVLQVVSSYFKYSPQLQDIANTIEEDEEAEATTTAILSKFIEQQTFAYLKDLTGISKLAVVGALLIIAAVALIAIYLANDTSLAWRITAAVSVGMLNLIFSIVKPILALRKLVNELVEIDEDLGLAETYLSLSTESSEITGASSKAGVIGLIISVAITVGVFVYLWGSGTIQPGTIAFNEAVAATIAAIIVAVVLYVLASTVIGSILVGILATIDIILLLLGKNWSITGKITQAIAGAIYQYKVFEEVDVEAGDLTIDLADPDRGMVAGNTISYTMPVTTTMTGKRGVTSLKANSMVYQLSENEVKLSTSRNVRKDDWDIIDPKPIGRIIDNLTYATTMRAGVNVPTSLVLNSAYSLEGQSCWVSFCTNKTIKGSSSDSLGSAIVFDVLPPTLEEFVKVSDWSEGRIVARDQDGDGLLSMSEGGVDPDDSTWDTDGDELSDAYELTMRARTSDERGYNLDPLSPDSDGDTLSDGLEIHLGTDPGRGDSDDDGIADAQEVAPDGGWFIAYAPDKFTKVWSSPLEADNDGDGMSDLFERTQDTCPDCDPWANADYPRVYSPAVWNESPVALYIEDDSVEGFISPDATLVYTTTTANNLSSSQSLAGELFLDPPAAFSGTPLEAEVNIVSGSSESLVSQLSSNVAASASYQFTSTMNLTDLGTTIWTWEEGQQTADGLKFGGGGRPDIAAVSGWTEPYVMAMKERDSSRITAYGVQADGTLKASPQYYSADNDTLTNPSIACANNGICLSIWGDNVVADEETYWGILFFRYHGSTNNPSTGYTAFDEGGQVSQPAIASDGQDFLLGWIVDGTNEQKIWLQVVKNSGEPAGDPQLLNESTAGLSNVTLEWNGSQYIAVWQDGSNLVRANVNPDGTVSNSEMIGSGSGWPDADGGTQSPQIAFDPLSRQSLLIYRDEVNGNAQLHARRLVGNASYQDTVLATDDLLNNAGVVTALCADPKNGGWVAAWALPGENKVTYQAISQDGSLRGFPQKSTLSSVAGLTLACLTTQPVLDLQFEEDAGATIFADSSGLGNDVSCASSAVCPLAGVEGRFGSGVRFDGADDYLQVNINQPGGNFSSDFWFRSNSQSATILHRQNDMKSVYLKNGNVCARVKKSVSGKEQNDIICSSGTNYADGNWHHVAHTAGGGVHSLYVDGNLQQRSGSISFAGCSGSACDSFTIASSDSLGVNFFQGSLDNVRFFNRELSSAEISDAFEAALAIYDLDETAGSITFTDATQNGYDASCSGGACPTMGVAGVASTAAQLDGSTEFITVNPRVREGAIISYDFESSVGSEWNPVKETSGLRKDQRTQFLGPYRNDTVTLDLSNLPSHDSIKISFDLYVLGEWSGVNGVTGPDNWEWGYNNKKVLRTNFSNILDTIGQYQLYPAQSWSLSGITLWQHSDCSGFRLDVAQNYSTLAGSGMGNNEVGCYTNPSDTVAVLFKKVNYEGTAWVIDPGRGQFPSIENNAVDSVAVWPVANTPGHGGDSSDLTVGNYPYPSTIYNIEFTIEGHTAKSLQLYFKGDVNTDITSDKDWGLDNVNITLQSEAGSLPLTDSSFTLSAWAQKDSGNGPGILLMQGMEQDNQGLHMGYRSENVFTCAFWNDNLDVTLSNIDEAWHHYACTYDAATNKRIIYRDGVKIAEDTAVADYSGFGPTFIGEGFNNDWRFQGIIDEVAVWAEALSAEAINDLYQKVKVEDESVMTALVLGSPGGDDVQMQNLILRETGTFLGLDAQAQGRTVSVDADLPQTTISIPQNGQVVRGQDRPTLQVSGAASDAGSQVDKVQVRVDNGSWQDAVGTESWSYSLDLSGLAEGGHTLSVRATDILGQVGPAVTTNFVLDRTPPDVQYENPPLRPTRDQDGRWRVRLTGTASDAHGVAAVEVLLGGEDDLSGQGWQEVVLDGNDWSLDYVLPPFNQNNQSNDDPSGTYQIFLQGSDDGGNSTQNLPSAGSFQLDADAPLPQLSNPISTTIVIDSAITFNGEITDVSTVAEVEINFTPAQQIDALNGAVLHLPFDENQATEYFPDQSGVNNTASCEGTECPAVNLEGRRDQAVMFNGVDDYLQIDHDDSLNFDSGQDFTIAFWVSADAYQPDTSSSQNVIVEKWAGAAYPYAIHLRNQSGLIWAGRSDGSSTPTLASSTPVNDGQFHHVALVKSGGTLSLYIDGNLESSVADATTGTTTNNAPLFIGRRSDGSIPFKGEVDELLVYERALAAYEVSDLYDYGFGTWQAATLNGNGWSYTLPEGANGLEGIYQVNVRGRDAVDNVTPLSGQNMWRGEIDTRPPALGFTAVIDSNGSTTTNYTCTTTDLNLDESSSCEPVVPATIPQFESGDITLTTYDQVDPWYAATFTDTMRIYGMDAAKTVAGAQDTSLSIRACDLSGRCTTTANSASPAPDDSELEKAERRSKDAGMQVFDMERVGEGFIRPLTNYEPSTAPAEDSSSPLPARVRGTVEADEKATDGTASQRSVVGASVMEDALAQEAIPVVDTTPPEITVDPRIDGELLGAGLHLLTGTMSDNEKPYRVQVCVPDEDCTTWPVQENGRWAAYLPSSGESNPDGLLQTLHVFGLDKAGNRSAEPVEVSYWLDINHPDLEISKVVDFVDENTLQSIFDGSAGDGSDFTIYVLATGPNGQTRRFRANQHGNWSFWTPSGIVGEYQISVQAIDAAGNIRTVGPFTVTFDFPTFGRPWSTYLPLLSANARLIVGTEVYFPTISNQ